MDSSQFTQAMTGQVHAPDTAVQMAQEAMEDPVYAQSLMDQYNWSQADLHSWCLRVLSPDQWEAAQTAALSAFSAGGA